MIRIAIVDDHQSLIDGMKLMLSKQENISVVATANNGEEFYEQLHVCRPHIVLTDIKMPKMDGIKLTKKIKQNWPDVKVIAFSMFNQEETLQKMIDAGVSGYLLKNSPLEEILTAIETVCKDKKYFDTELFNAKNSNSHNDIKSKLTPSEIKILRLIADGLTTAEIAEKRGTAISTVQKHRKNMAHKLELKGKGELMRYAYANKYRF
ncbi:MAG: response regulator [Bacteroidota bacterium]